MTYKVIVSTQETLGDKRGDFNFVPPGEILYPSHSCDRRECDCTGIWCGITCRKGTVLGKIAEVGELPDEITNAPTNDEIIRTVSPHSPTTPVGRESVEVMQDIAKMFRTGTVIQFTDHRITERKPQK